MLAYQGMQVAEVFGDYALGPYKMTESPRLIVVARRPGLIAAGRRAWLPLESFTGWYPRYPPRLPWRR